MLLTDLGELCSAVIGLEGNQHTLAVPVSRIQLEVWEDEWGIVWCENKEGERVGDGEKDGVL